MPHAMIVFYFFTIAVAHYSDGTKLRNMHLNFVLQETRKFLWQTIFVGFKDAPRQSCTCQGSLQIVKAEWIKSFSFRMSSQDEIK